MIDNKTIADEIRQIRTQDLKLSQRALAKLIGSSRDTVKDCELDRQKVPAVIFLNIYALLNREALINRISKVANGNKA